MLGTREDTMSAKMTFGVGADRETLVAAVYRAFVSWGGRHLILEN